MDFLFGFFRPSIWVYFVVALVFFQLTVISVTLYLHRDQAHRSVDLHPAIRHFCRLWVWMTSGMLTKEWVAVHRKHHAKCETDEDPHSPRCKGLRKVLLEGAELYQVETKNPETLKQYGRGTPDDWLEKNLYLKFPYGGLVAMFAIDVLLFGVVGITIWAFQMMSMPLFAAGVINGLGHHSGYRNFECDDAATNIVPWGVVLGGEELHNNHHAFPSSAKFSVRSWEFDIGWMYLTIFKTLGLAKIRRVAPTPAFEDKPKVDVETVSAIVLNRMHVLRTYARAVTLPVLQAEKARQSAANAGDMWRRAKRILVRRPELLSRRHRERLEQLLANNEKLKTVHELREKLRGLWTGATVSNDKLIQQLKDWCKEAEATGIRALQEFSQHLKTYTLQPQPAAH
ncbi:MAG: acyl-CoA desaturase [Gammaproteobacteria bacterium]|nr:acyl-CoA desaturase [Gammaproteobacteria bacterium]